jgi:hypothetical protein
MAAGESHVSSCLKRSWYLRSFFVFFLYDFRAARKIRSILEEDPEDVVAGVWGIVETAAECCIVEEWENAVHCVYVRNTHASC